MMSIIKKKAAILAVSVVTLGALGGAAAMTQPTKTGATTTPIVTELDNHEVRISNAENNIRALQTSTNTQPNPTNTPVPTVNSTNQATATGTSTSTVDTAPAAVTVTAYREIVLDADNSDCEYTYSDGTTYQFHWKTSNPQGSWMTDGVGQNGHWVKTTQTSGSCDQRAIGQPKQ